jgi:4-hydroxy-tetrahydrodipicolinate synthase
LELINNITLWTALITPFLENGDIDCEGLNTLIEEQNEAGNGLLILGSTGEALNLTLNERKEVLTHVLAQDLKVPVMVGVGGSCLSETKEWISYVNKLAVHALLLVTPLYARPETQGQYLWFKELLELAKSPCMLYNVPSRTGKSLSYDAVSMLKDHPNFWAIKEASGSLEDFKAYQKAAPNIELFSGDDALTPTFCKHGAKGLVSVASNAWPKQTALFVRESIAGKLEAAEISLWDACSGALFCVSNPIPVKRLICENKKIASSHLRLPLSHLDLSQAATVLEASLRINNWYKERTK